jgi:hypothetical protein
LLTQQSWRFAIGKKTKALYEELLKQIRAMQAAPKPENKPLDLMTQQAMEAAELLKSRDYNNLNKNGNMLLNFEMPAEQQRKRFLTTNAAKGGTFSLADNSGATGATKIAGQYMQDRFARDTAQNFQDNIQRAGDTTRATLATAAGGVMDANSLEQQKRLAAMNALGSLYHTQKSVNSSNNPLGAILGGAATVGASAITKW